MASSAASPPSVRSEAIESALRDLLGPSAGPQGLITLRRHDEYELLIERIRGLAADLRRKDQELCSMASYPILYLQALDELRSARRQLHSLGVDTSFIRSLRPGGR